MGNLLSVIQHNLTGFIALIIIAAVVLLLGGWRKSQAATPYPYIRGTELYRLSLAYRESTPPIRMAMNLPPYHDESQWRNPPG